MKKPNNNPWGLSPRLAEAMDAVVETGSCADAANLMGISPKTHERHMLEVSIRMGNGYKNRVQRIVAWDRWRREGSK